MVDISWLQTEEDNENSYNIDRACTEEALKIINNEDKKVPAAIEKEIKTIGNVIESIHARLNADDDSRLVYVGAGTSGRIGILDSSEIVPTFNFDRIVGSIAGGMESFFTARESREDSKEAGKEEMKKIGINRKDSVIGIMASGRTPYTIGALEESKDKGALAIALTCNPKAKLNFDYHRAINVGPEVITGSTRMKAGTAQKLVLNMISTTLMIKMGKTYHNLMVDVIPKNEKLVGRSINIIQKTTGLTRGKAEEYFIKSGRMNKVAIVMVKLNISKERAEKILDENKGILSRVLEQGLNRR